MENALHSAYEEDYKQLVVWALEHGQKKPSRVGETTSFFGMGLRIDSLRQGQFPILTGRKMFYKPVFGELTAFLCGSRTLASYKKYGCNYWDANAKEWVGNLGLTEDKFNVGKIYGAQWRDWTGSKQNVDQIDELLNGITKDPFSRRHILTTWNPAELHLACLPPCHLMAQFNVTPDGYLDCSVFMRSVDLCLGLPTDVILYAALLLIVARQTGYEPGTLIFMLGDAHVYSNHVAGWDEYMGRPTHPLPTWNLNHEVTVNDFVPLDLVLPDYVSEEVIKYELNV